jgi:hypothetical protein
VIEIVSPTNKLPGTGRKQYLQKQREVLAGETSLVEIDLVRAGNHVLAVPFGLLPPAYQTPFLTCVRRGWDILKAEVYRIPLQEPLPAIRIPLREKDSDAVLNLQSLVEQAYEDGQYGDLNYTKDPVPPLEGTDAAWADELLRQAGKR